MSPNTVKIGVILPCKDDVLLSDLYNLCRETIQGNISIFCIWNRDFWKQLIWTGHMEQRYSTNILFLLQSMLQVVWNIIKYIYGLLYAIVRPVRRLVCRRRKLSTSEDDIALTSVATGNLRLSTPQQYGEEQEADVSCHFFSFPVTLSECKQT